MRRVALAAALVAVIAVPSVSTTAAAFAKPSPGASGRLAVTTKPAARRAAPAKPAKPVKVVFTANGTVTAVDKPGGTLTVAAKAGSKDVKGKTVTVAVPSTVRIVLNGARKTLDDLATGYRITIVGVHQGTTYTAVKIQAAVVRVTPSPSASVTPSPTVSPTPTDDVAPDPSDSAGPDPSTTPTAA